MADIDVSNLSIDYCTECGEGSCCVEGLCRKCRTRLNLVVHPNYLATIYGTPAMHSRDANCTICRGWKPGEE